MFTEENELWFGYYLIPLIRHQKRKLSAEGSVRNLYIQLYIGKKVAFIRRRSIDHKTSMGEIQVPRHALDWNLVNLT